MNRTRAAAVRATLTFATGVSIAYPIFHSPIAPPIRAFIGGGILWLFCVLACAELYGDDDDGDADAGGAT